MSKQDKSATPAARQKASDETASATPLAIQTGGVAASVIERSKDKVAKQPNKIEQVMALLTCPHGATLAEMVKVTGWQKHTVRAALTGLKKKGHVIERGQRDGITCYTIVAGA